MKDAVGTSLKKTKKMYLNIGIAYRVAASYFAAIRKPDEAERYYRLSIDANQKVARRYEVARSFYDYGVFLRRTGDLTGAWDILLSAYMLFEEIGVSAFRKRITKHLGLSQQPSDNAETAISREKMQYLLEKSREFGACSDLGDLLDRVLALAMEISGGRNGHLFLYDEDEGKLVKAASRFGDSTAPLDYSSHIVDRVFDCGKSLLIADAEMDESLSAYRSVSGQALKSVICLPLSYGDVVIGVCYFDNPLASGIFSEGTERLLEMLFSHAVVVIENLVLRARLDSRTGIEKLAHTDEQYVENAARYLDEHYPEEFHREKISGLLGVNADYLGRVFKAGTGKTMREYLNEARVREAVKRLADRDARIIDIAMDAGFDSMRTFYRIFYRIMGFTPAEYREKISKR